MPNEDPKSLQAKTKRRWYPHLISALGPSKPYQEHNIDFVENIEPVNTYDPIFLEAADKYDVSYTMLKAIAAAESRFDPKAKSPQGAMGLMQITKPTWRQFGEGGDPFNPKDSIMTAARTLRWLMNTQTGGGDFERTLAAYNYGIGNVSRLLGKYGEDEWKKHLPKETIDYIERVSMFTDMFTKDLVPKDNK